MTLSANTNRHWIDPVLDQITRWTAEDAAGLLFAKYQGKEEPTEEAVQEAVQLVQQRIGVTFNSYREQCIQLTWPLYCSAKEASKKLGKFQKQVLVKILALTNTEDRQAILTSSSWPAEQKPDIDALSHCLRRLEERNLIIRHFGKGAVELTGTGYVLATYFENINLDS
jgi:hypothetical protein